MAAVPNLRRSVDAAVKAAGDRLTPEDAATIAAARAYATVVDEVLQDPEVDGEAKTKALHAIPHLTNTLRMLGLNPIGRQEIAAMKAKADAAKAPAPAKTKGSAALKQATGLRAVK